MFDSIRSFFHEHLRQPESGGEAPDALALASAALMFEVMRADAAFDAREQARVRSVLRDTFRLDEAALDELESLARGQVEQATDLYQFTTLINDHYGPEDRITLIRNLWAVAWADGEVDRLEDHLIRRVADLLHVRHRDFISAKLAVKPDGID